MHLRHMRNFWHLKTMSELVVVTNVVVRLVNTGYLDKDTHIKII